MELSRQIKQDLKRFALPTGFRGKPAWFVQLWWITEALLFNSSPQFFYKWRILLLKIFGAKIGKGVLIRSSVHIQFPWKIEIGDYSWIGDEVVLYSLDDIVIGKNVVVSQRSYICTGTHDYNESTFPIISKKVIIEDECWIATDVFIGLGVTIKKGTIVGARSSVFHSLPPNMICFGTPAKPIKSRL